MGMKVKICVLTLLVVGLVFGFAVNSHAALGEAVAASDAATTVAAADSFVSCAFTVTAGADGDIIGAIRTTGTLVGVLKDDIKMVSVYIDKNEDGAWDSNDVFVGKAAAPAAWGNPTNQDIDIDDITLVTAADTKDFIVVVTLDKKEDTVGTYDGGTIKGNFNAAASIAALGAVTVGATVETVAIVASHLQWQFATDVYASTGTLFPGGGVTNDALYAVDDYGNLDSGFAEYAVISAVKYTNPSETPTLTITATVGDAGDATAVDQLLFTGGKIQFDSNDASENMLKVFSIDNGGTDQAVTVMARSSGAAPAGTTYDGKNLIGTQTLVIGAATAFTGTNIQNTRGVEIYDTNHNGKIDHITMLFSAPITIGATASTAFTAQGYIVKSTTPVLSFDAGGTGIYNAGPFGVTFEIKEGAVTDTNARPDVTYTAGALVNRAGAPASIPSVGSGALAIEVDRARPVMMSVETQDTGIGAGTASNGIVDGFKLTFSEPIANVNAGVDTSATISLAVHPDEGISFNQGSGTISDKTLIIPVFEGAIDTGITPSVIYKQWKSNLLIKDFATSASGGTDPNALYPDKTTYADGMTFTVADGAPMVVYSVETADSGAGTGTANNGKIDAMVVTFSEIPTDGSGTGAGVEFVSSITAFGSTGNGIYDVNAATGPTGQALTFAVTEATSATIFDTEAVPEFNYNPGASGADIHDAADVDLQQYGPGGLVSPTTSDGAAPVAVSVLTRDSFADTTFAGETLLVSDTPNGRIDGIAVVFSEQVKTNEGAENGGTALDHSVGQFNVVHELVAGNRTKFLTTNAFGKPTWVDANINGDSKSSMTFFFREIPMDTAAMVNHGDTGKTGHTVSYTADGTYVSFHISDISANSNAFAGVGLATVSDGAAPFLVDGFGKGWGANAFANIQTVDSDSAVVAGAGDDTGNGNGWIDAYKLQFSEVVTVYKSSAAMVNNTTTADSLNAFTCDLPGAGALQFKAAMVNNNATNTITLLGHPNYKGDPDTDSTPPLSFTGKIAIQDNGGNNLAAFVDRASYDAARPVIVEVNTGSALNKIKFTFSEPITTHDADGKNISFAGANKLGNVLFGYENVNPTGASALTSAYVVRISDRELEVTVNADILVEDIEDDRMWVKSQNIWDDANAVETKLADNYAFYQTAGLNIKINIFDDVVAPFIIAAQTVDADADGLVDHIKFTFSEAIDDATLQGFLGHNMMSADVEATWNISGYSGTAMWNLFDGNTDAGKAAAAAAGKPAFVGNNKNDEVLFLELEEALVPVNSVTGVGSTQFAPTVTWGVVTLGDFRPNVLDTESIDEDAVNGVVKDLVAPVLVSAEYIEPTAKIATDVGGQIRMLFSEPMKSITKKLVNSTFIVSGDGTTADKFILWGYAWENTGTLTLDVRSDYKFAVNGAPNIQIAANGSYFEDAAGTDLVVTAAATPYPDAMYYKVGSPMSGSHDAGAAKTVGTTTIGGLTWLDFSKFDPAILTAGEPVAIKWTSSNVENVDLYISFNSGNDWKLVEGSTTPAADKELSWVPQLNVDTIKLQAAEDATIKDTKTSLSVVSDFNANNGGATIGAPSGLVMPDMPNDNGAFLIAQFGVSADHLTAVNSYQFYREYALDAADPNDLTEVLWAVVAAGVVDDANVQSVIVPTIDNTESNWTVRASTGSEISDKAAKEAGDAVATVVFGSAEKAASGSFDLSAASNVAVGAAIDNIAPSALDDFAVASGEAGVRISWTAPEDHGIVGSYDIFGATNYIHGVDSYDVYCRIKGEDEFVLVGSAGPGSEFYDDVMEAGAAVYQYYVKAVDGNPDHIVETDVRSGIAATELSGDFSGDTIVDASDFSIFASNYGTVNEGNEADYVWAYDLNADGVVNSSDFSIFAAGYGATLKLAKAAVLDMPTSDIPFAMGATIDESTSTYFLNVNIGETETLKGFEFYLSYNTEALEFVENSVNGLVGLNITNVDEDGIIRVSDWFAGEQFDGTVTLAFRSNGVNNNLTFEILNAMVDDVDGLALSTNVSDYEARALPTVYALSQNYPNPFNPTTTIDYSIPKSGNVELVIFNMTGQKVRTLVSGKQDAAFYKIVWDGRNELGENVASGLYFYRLVSGSFSNIEKMTLIK